MAVPATASERRAVKSPKGGLERRNRYGILFCLPNLIACTSVALLFKTLLDWRFGSINQILMTLGVVSQPINWLTAQLVVGVRQKGKTRFGRNFVRKFLPKLLWNQPNVIELQEFSTYRRTISWKYHYLSLWAEPIIKRAIISCLIYSHLKAFLLVSGANDGNTI